MSMRAGARRVAEGFAATGGSAAAAQAFEELASERSRGRAQPPAAV
jgi:UDP:flavonoid glycosyltransferase YjiC (YdhE family)